MRIQMLAVGVVMACAAGSLPAQDAATLQIELDQVKGERDALRVQLAQAQLRISQLEAQVKRIQGGDGATPTIAADNAGETIVTIKVTSVTTADVADLKAQLMQRKKELQGMDKELTEAKKRLDRMEWENRYTKRPNSSVALGSARADISKIETRQRNGRVQVSRLEGEIQEANTTRLISGHDVLSGDLIKAVATGPTAQLAATLQPEKIYTLTGRKRTLNGATELMVRTIKAE